MAAETTLVVACSPVHPCHRRNRVVSRLSNEGALCHTQVRYPRRALPRTRIENLVCAMLRSESHQFGCQKIPNQLLRADGNRSEESHGGRLPETSVTQIVTGRSVMTWRATKSRIRLCFPQGTPLCDDTRSLSTTIFMRQRGWRTFQSTTQAMATTKPPESELP